MTRKTNPLVSQFIRSQCNYKQDELQNSPIIALNSQKTTMSNYKHSKWWDILESETSLEVGKTKD